MKRKSRTKNCGRTRKGGAMSVLEAGNYPGSVTSTGGQWSSSVAGNPVAAAASSYHPFLSKFAADSGGAGENPALARQMLSSYALTGPGQSGGGSKRRKHHHKRGKKHGSKRMRRSYSQGQSQGQAQGQSQGQAQGQSQSGGMFATFGALLKEALVPLGLLAAQQAYGKKYDSKNRTRKSRK
jgi:hypothetical protein